MPTKRRPGYCQNCGEFALLKALRLCPKCYYKHVKRTDTTGIERSRRYRRRIKQNPYKVNKLREQWRIRSHKYYHCHAKIVNERRKRKRGIRKMSRVIARIVNFLEHQQYLCDFGLLPEIGFFVDCSGDFLP